MIEKRLNFSFVIFILITLAVILRLFYWQVIASDSLAALAESQHISVVEIPAHRGEIRTSDGFPLATNKESFLIFAYKPQLNKDPQELSNLLYPIIGSNITQKIATESAIKAGELQKLSLLALQEKFTRDDRFWIPIVNNADLSQKKEIEKLDLDGIGIEPSFVRDYPEASMAASLLGFVGSDTAGNPKGYFGLEGFYELELRGKPGNLEQEKDASGQPILIGQFSELEPKRGRHLLLHLDRAIQNIVEEKLKQGLLKYGAKSGEIAVMDPQTGAIVAMSSLPAYDPAQFYKHDPQLYKNPVISESYEPGSTFKVITMSAALDSGAVNPETSCNICSGPVTIGAYTIGTWNDEYRPDLNMKEVIQYSDNVGMVFVSQRLGKEKLLEYLKLFGFGEKTGIDLEEEATAPLRSADQWRDIDLATASFGQGIAVTGIQMLRAVSAVANNGLMPIPRVVSQVIGESVLDIETKPPVRVISPSSAQQMTDFMVNAVDNGEAKWAKPRGFKIAGKTGTAQIPVAGHYDEEKTIASFIGFAPADDPKFVMLVKLREPQSSPWGSETAAPLWFSIARDILFYYGIQPEE